MWAETDNGKDVNWKDAKSYCENYRGGGYTDWRMPTQDELEGLYDKSKTYRSDCGYDVNLTELIRLTCVGPWASESRNRFLGPEASLFNFSTGLPTESFQSGDYNTRALPVRSVK
ncbi:DUF1566 domain-containing protein [Patescibacteria group bacterium]|nr:DUF1566 domain-containing protein [Patescibacteria group bacterium]